MTDTTHIPRHEIEQFLDGKPDTKLKKELLDMIQPEEDKQKAFEQYAQHVYNLLCEALGKRRITIRPGKDHYGESFTNEEISAGKFYASFDITLGYERQQRIEISPKERGYTSATIRVDPKNPERYIAIAKTVLDALNGEK